jgi:chorismate mutase
VGPGVGLDPVDKRNVALAWNRTRVIQAVARRHTDRAIPVFKGSRERKSYRRMRENMNSAENVNMRATSSFIYVIRVPHCVFIMDFTSALAVRMRQ